MISHRGEPLRSLALPLRSRNNHRCRRGLPPRNQCATAWLSGAFLRLTISSNGENKQNLQKSLLGYPNALFGGKRNISHFSPALIHKCKIKKCMKQKEKEGRIQKKRRKSIYITLIFSLLYPFNIFPQYFPCSPFCSSFLLSFCRKKWGQIKI